MSNITIGKNNRGNVQSGGPQQTPQLLIALATLFVSFFVVKHQILMRKKKYEEIERKNMNDKNKNKLINSGAKYIKVKSMKVEMMMSQANITIKLADNMDVLDHVEMRKSLKFDITLISSFKRMPALKIYHLIDFNFS